MGLTRSLLLKASDSVWLRTNATRAPFVRRAVSRFMPGETFDEMLAAARAESKAGIPAIFTRLGENVADLNEADAVTEHYIEGIARAGAGAVDCEPSVKLTQLGFDIDRERAFTNLHAIAAAASAAGMFLWIDMEQSHYVDVTLDVTERLGRDFPRIGVALQAYLYRTDRDLERMLDLGIGIRLVKGAYREPASIAFPRKADVDANYMTLARRMLAPDRTSRAVFGTHDTAIIEAIQTAAREMKRPRGHYEFHLLYGIRRAEQVRLVSAGESVRVLISYGPYWWPWYMRRLAERPANLWFVAKSLVAR